MNYYLCFVAILIAIMGPRPLCASQFVPLGGIEYSSIVSTATALSADGSTVIGWTGPPSTNFPSRSEAFRWTAAEGMHFLRPSPTQQYPDSFPFGVSRDGKTVVGHRYDLAKGGEAFRWTADSGIAGLGFPAPAPAGDDDKSRALVVSSDGKVVYGDSQTSFPFRWTTTEGMTAFPLQVVAISADDSVLVGMYSGQSGNPEAFRWTEAAGAVGLGDLPGGSFFSSARAVSGDGQVVVGESASASGTEAFRWTASGGMQALGDFPGGNYQSYATAVSARGDIVFGTGYSQSGSLAFIWDGARGMRDLQQVLSDQHGLESALTGWRLYSVAGISSDGRTIAGNGTNPNGSGEAWIVRLDQPIGVPEPSALAASIIAGVFGFWLRRS